MRGWEDVPPHPEVVPEQPERHAREAFSSELGDKPLALVEPDRECAVLGGDEEYSDLSAIALACIDEEENKLDRLTFA